MYLRQQQQKTTYLQIQLLFTTTTMLFTTTTMLFQQQLCYLQLQLCYFYYSTQVPLPAVPATVCTSRKNAN